MRVLREDGTACVEFVIVFFPVFSIVLGVAQLSFLYAAKLVVRHAALSAARSAIVVLSDDPKHYGGAPVGAVSLASAGGRQSPIDRAVSKVRSLVGVDNAQVGKGGPAHKKGRSGGPRLDAIRAAAYRPLLSVAPDWRQLTSSASIEAAIGTPGDRLLSGLAYNLGAVAVTFPTGPGEDRLRTEVGCKDSVTVRVTYLFHCGVPLASALLCDRYADLMTGRPIMRLFERASKLGSRSLSTATLRRWTEDFQAARERLKTSSRGFAELAQVEAPGLQLAAGLGGGRFRVLRAEATLPNQGARYVCEAAAN